jgi:hypothetical protein
VHGRDSAALVSHFGQLVHVVDPVRFSGSQDAAHALHRMSMMPTPTATVNDPTWVALPGLFEATEIVADDTLEIRALPLLLVHDKTYYVVYVRESMRADSIPVARTAA